MKQRGITTLEVEHVFAHPIYVKKTFDERKETAGEIRGRRVKIIYVEMENYINR